MVSRSAELGLLGGDADAGDSGGLSHELTTAPLLTYDVFESSPREAFPQTSVVGQVLKQNADKPCPLGDPRLYINTNAPLSAVVCGVQGSGKSHTVSVLLENYFLTDERIGQLQQPMSGVVFHFESVSGGSEVPACEAAYVSKGQGGQRAVDVTVLVSPSNINRMRKAYAHLPVNVQPFRLFQSDITADRLQALMLCDTSEKRPLYMERALGMMRDMGERFDYREFRQCLKKEEWLPAQKVALEQRLNLLDGYTRDGTALNNVKAQFGAGKLVIIDLTDPMVDAMTSSGLFDICLGLFMERKIQGGKVIVLDEAHKYLTDDHGASRLVSSIESLIRQQRHLGARTIISTQEPTVISPKILDLVSFMVIHRFSSPSWASHLDKHVSLSPAASRSQDQTPTSWFELAVKLRTGQAIVFSPSARMLKYAEDEVDFDSWGSRRKHIEPMGSGYFIIRTRRRLTADGGASVLAIGEPNRLSNVLKGKAKAAEAAPPPSATSTPPLERDPSPPTPRFFVPSVFTHAPPYTGALAKYAASAVAAPASSVGAAPAAPLQSPKPKKPAAKAAPSYDRRFLPLLQSVYKWAAANSTSVAQWSQLGPDLKQSDIYDRLELPGKGRLRALLELAEKEGLVALEFCPTDTSYVWLTAQGKAAIGA